MHAWVGHAYGPPESLVWEEMADRPLDVGEVRIEIAACAVNFPDVLFTAGTYQVKPTPPFVPGFEIAGVVCESRSEDRPVGTRVASLLNPYGGYATHAVAHAWQTFVLPEAMTLEEAAAMTVTYQTGWFSLHRRAHLAQGEWLLVHAGAGGVGSAAIQLGKVAGARVIATAGGPDKVEVCRKLGADHAIDYRREDFVERVKSLTSGRGADVVFDPVGGEIFEKSTKCIAFEGRILVIGFTSGRFPEVRANHVLVKNYSVVGVHWGLYAKYDALAIVRAQEELYGLWSEKKIAPLVSDRRPMREAPQAMKAVADRATTGKVLLVP